MLSLTNELTINLKEIEVIDATHFKYQGHVYHVGELRNNDRFTSDTYDRVCLVCSKCSPRKQWTLVDSLPLEAKALKNWNDSRELFVCPDYTDTGYVFEHFQHVGLIFQKKMQVYTSKHMMSVLVYEHDTVIEPKHNPFLKEKP